MKRKDIQVGQEYAVWHGKNVLPYKNYAGGRNVVRVSVMGFAPDGNVVGVSLRHGNITRDASSVNRHWPTREVRMPWPEYEAATAVVDEASKVKQDARESLEARRGEMCARLDKALGKAVRRKFDNTPDFSDIGHFVELVRLVEAGVRLDSMTHGLVSAPLEDLG